jgi:hypothetical protein
MNSLTATESAKHERANDLVFPPGKHSVLVTSPGGLLVFELVFFVVAGLVPTRRNFPAAE